VFEVDTGGDPTEWTLLRWTSTAPFGAAFEGLRALSARDGDHEGIELENGPDGEPNAAITWYRRSGLANDDWKMIGFLFLDEGRLAAAVPTRTLTDRLVGEVGARLGAAVTLIERRPSMPARVHTARHQDSVSQRQNSARARTLLGRPRKTVGGRRPAHRDARCHPQ
jgi:hypothetical protein